MSILHLGTRAGKNVLWLNISFIFFRRCKTKLKRSQKLYRDIEVKGHQHKVADDEQMYKKQTNRSSEDKNTNLTVS